MEENCEEGEKARAQIEARRRKRGNSPHGYSSSPSSREVLGDRLNKPAPG